MLEKNFNIFSCDRADTHGKKQERFNSIRLLLRGENTHCKVCNVEHINFWWMWQITYFCMEKEKKLLWLPADLWSSFFTFPSRLEDLRVKLENEGLVNISYVVVNHQSPHSQKKFHLLQESVSDHITVYQQDDHQADVWTTLNGNKDDFLIYDRFVFKGKDWKNICVYLE